MRRRSRILPRRSGRAWGARVGLALAATALGTWLITQSLAYTERGVAPEIAHRLAPNDGRLTALLSEKMSNPSATPAEREKADELARLALRQDPTAVAAVATLGIDRQIKGDTRGAKRAFAYAQMLSRRDLRTQLWAIEDAVSRGDVGAALKQYDITLRTSSYGPDLLFPVLTTAIADPAIRIALIRTLAAKPAWTPAFIEYVAESTSDPRTVFELFNGLRRAGVPISGNAQGVLIRALLDAKLYDQAWAYYTTLRPGSARRMSRDPRFAADINIASPLDWAVVNDGGTSTSIQHNGKTGVFDFSVSPSLSGLMLRQTQLLPAGSYLLRGHSLNVDQPTDSRPYWTLTCQDGRELGRVELPNSAQAGGNFSGRFDVPPGCPMQYLSLQARPSDTVGGVTGQIDHVQLAPMR